MSDVTKSESVNPKRNMVKFNGALRGPKPESFVAEESPLLPQISRTLNNKSEGTYRPQGANLEKHGNPVMMLMNDMSSFDLDSQDAKHISSTKDTKTGTRNTQARSQKAGGHVHDLHNSNSYNNKSFDDLRGDRAAVGSTNNITPKKNRG